MPLKYTPDLLGNDFEGEVVRLLGSQLNENGFIAHNILLPDVNNRYNPNEHDIILLLPWAAYTIDAKEYKPGYYNIPGNSPAGWRKLSPEFTREDGKTKKLPHLPNPFHVAKQKASILHSTCKKIKGMGNYPVQSLIVVPDHAEVTPNSHPHTNQDGSAFNLRVLKLSQLVSAIVKDKNARKGGPYTEDEQRQIFKKLQALPRQLTEGISLCGVRLEAPLDRSEPGCPVSMTAYEGVHELSKMPVEVRIYRKWPWNEDSDRFLDRVQRRLQAILTVSSPHVMRVITSEELPDMVVMAFIQYEGESLAELVKGGDSLPVTLVKSLLKNIAGTVKELHQQNIIHLDIRPEHVLVAPNLESHGGEQHLLTGFTNPLIDSGCLSTQIFRDAFEASFSAPEMQSHRQPDREKPQNDIFSLGRLAAYCVLGDAEYRQRLRDGKIDLQGVDTHLAGIINCATQFRSSDRYGNIDEMLAALSES